MIFPVGDSPNPRGTPWVNYALIAANVLVYVLVSLPLSGRGVDPADPALREYLRVVTEDGGRPIPIHVVLEETSAYDLFVFKWGFRPAEASVVTLFTSMFLHGGFLHLFGNMLFLWIYGDNVEFRLGRLPYLLWYLATGAAATFFFLIFDVNSPLPLVGASGAISGVLGFYFLFFPRNRVKLWFFFFPFIMDVLYVPARIVLGFYLLFDNLLPFLVARGPAMGGVAHGAHIGGFVAGLAVAFFLDRRSISARPEGAPRAEGRIAGDARAAIAERISEGDAAGAAAAYFSVDPDETRRLLAPGDALVLADWLARNGHPKAALVVLRRHMRDYPRGPLSAEAHVAAGEVFLHALHQPTTAYQHFLDALDLDPAPETAARARAYLAEIAR